MKYLYHGLSVCTKDNPIISSYRLTCGITNDFYQRQSLVEIVSYTTCKPIRGDNRIIFCDSSTGESMCMKYWLTAFDV